MYLLESNNNKINEIFKVQFGESLVTGGIITCGRELNITSSENQKFTFRDNCNNGFQTSHVLEANIVEQMYDLNVNNKIIPTFLKLFKVKTANSTYVFLTDETLQVMFNH